MAVLLFSGERSMITTQQMDTLFNPRSVAVIGASNNLGKWGFSILALLVGDKSKEVYAINKKEALVQNRQAYRSLLEVPAAIDEVIITVPFQGVPAAMEDCVKKSVKSVVVISGGLSESGEEGAEVEKQIVEIARRGGIRFVGPNCMGLFNTYSDYNTVIALPPLKKGPISIISQSGNSGRALVMAALEVGLGINKYVSTGNEANIHLEDYLEYMAQDEETKVILCYIEGLREGRRFFELAKEITKKKPIVVVKGGRTQAGAKAARSHTAALAGSDLVIDAAFRQAGVIRVDEISDLADVSMPLLGQPLTKGRRVGVLSLGGGAAVMVSDALVKQGLGLATLTPATIEKINTLYSLRWSHTNPIDPGGDRLNYGCLWPLIEDENIDVVLLIGAPDNVGSYKGWIPKYAPWITNLEQMRRLGEEKEIEELDKLKGMMREFGKPVVFCSSGTSVERQGTIYDWTERNHMVAFTTLERAAKALGYLVRYSEYVKSVSG